jgi:hypothetical protein
MLVVVIAELVVALPVAAAPPVALECTCCGTKTTSIAAIASIDLQRLDLFIRKEHLFEGMVMVVVAGCIVKSALFFTLVVIPSF